MSIKFPDVKTFKPNLTPEQVIRAGSFGGIYFDEEFPGIEICLLKHDWFKGLDKSQYARKSRDYDPKINFYGVRAGQSQIDWENAGWINKQDPRGWFQWYCRFFLGRRTDDDARQISRWNKLAGDTGRWRNTLYNKIHFNGGESVLYDGTQFSVIRQTLLHWAYVPNKADYIDWCSNKGIIPNIQYYER
jgi:hypothetical protein